MFCRRRRCCCCCCCGCGVLVGVVAASPSAHKFSFVFAAVWKPQIHFELLGSSTVLMERLHSFPKQGREHSSPESSSQIIANNLRRLRLRRLKVSRP